MSKPLRYLLIHDDGHRLKCVAKSTSDKDKVMRLASSRVRTADTLFCRGMNGASDFDCHICPVNTMGLKVGGMCSPAHEKFIVKLDNKKQINYI